MARDTSGFQQVMVRMPADLHAEVMRVAKERDLSMAQLVRAAVRAWLKEPSLEEVRAASGRGPCVCLGPFDNEIQRPVMVVPHCPQHGQRENVGA